MTPRFYLTPGHNGIEVGASEFLEKLDFATNGIVRFGEYFLLDCMIDSSGHLSVYLFCDIHNEACLWKKNWQQVKSPAIFVASIQAAIKIIEFIDAVDPEPVTDEEAAMFLFEGGA